ncbi:unnamed protein product [Schistosoma turkestanicum]|nr:unnamed protein product [Schistosoma turkestanicum]
MYIESSGGYAKKWGGRSHTATAYGADSTMTAAHRSGTSLKTKARKTLVCQTQSASQLSPMAYLPQPQQQQQLDFQSLNGGSLTMTNNQYPLLKHASSFVCSRSVGPNTTTITGGYERIDTIQAKSTTDIETAQASISLRCPPANLPTENIFNNNNNNTTYINKSSNIIYSSNGPKESKGLSKEIALRIKEKFDQRVSKHLSKSKQKSKSSPYTYTSQYHLLAVFLVNKGHVEAWYAYSSMPNYYYNNNYQQNELGHSRLLELTQRRLRLLQRYYSDCRQYVVLYVNSNNSEHYLPMGLVNDVNSSRQNTNNNKNHSLSINRLFCEKNRPIYRFVNALLPKNMKFVNTTDNNNNSNNDNDKRLFVDKNEHSTNLTTDNEKLTSRTSDCQHQSRRQRQQQQPQTINNQIEQKESNEMELGKVTNSINQRPNLWRRLLGHLTSYHHSTDSSTISSSKNSYEENNNNNNNIDNHTNSTTNIDRDNCSDNNNNEKIDFKCYETCLHLDSCLVRADSRQQHHTSPMKPDESVPPSSTKITMNPIDENTCTNNLNIESNNNNHCENIEKNDCLIAAIQRKTTNQQDLSNMHRKLSDVSKHYTDSQQTGDSNEGEQKKCTVKQTKQLSDCEEIWLPKSFEL